MSGLMGSLLGKRDPKQQATQAIIGLREQLAMIDKKEEHLDRRIEEETNTAKASLADNKRRTLCPLCLEAGGTDPCSCVSL
jgi:charged multivesicular body protein 4A/B